MSTAGTREDKHMNKLTPAELTEARDWIADCTWGDDTSNLTDAQVERGIARHYAGGIAAFRTSCA